MYIPSTPSVAGLNTTPAISNSIASISAGMNSQNDSASKAIAETFSRSISEKVVENRNSTDGLSMLQTLNGAQESLASNLNNMRELALQAGGVLNDGQKSALNTEFQSLLEEIDRVAETTEFNGQKLMDGSLTDITIGASSDGGVNVQLEDMRAQQLNLDDLDISAGGNPAAAIQGIDAALEKIMEESAQTGAQANEMVYKQSVSSGAQLSEKAARSRIEDANMAQEMMRKSQQDISQQAAVAMQAQRNHHSQDVLQLLQA